MRIFFFVTSVIAIASGYYFNQDVSKASDAQFSIVMLISGPWGFVIPLKMYPIFIVGYLFSGLPLLLLKKMKSSYLLRVAIVVISVIIWLTFGFMALTAIR